MTNSFKADRIFIASEPPTAYKNYLDEKRAFFEGQVWGEVLQAGFGCERWYVWDCTNSVGHALTLFRKGPFRIGYLGFPICASAEQTGQAYALDDMVAAIRRHPRRPDLLRVSPSAFGRRELNQSDESALLLETSIVDLDSWTADATATRRRDIAFANRHCNIYTRQLANGQELFGLYQSAVTRNRGRMRYSQKYFEKISEIAAEGIAKIFCLHDGENAVAMAITIRHGTSSYYLHGGVKSSALSHGATDFLLAEAINDAKASGSIQFNLLSSPTDQPGLIKFKEKWGGITRKANSYDISLTLKGYVFLTINKSRALQSRRTSQTNNTSA